MPHPDRVRGALLGAAVGDALGMPVEGLSHQNVRTYYKGVKGYRADEKRGDIGAGEGTHRTTRLLALTRALAAGVPLADAYRQQLREVDLPRWDPEDAEGPTGGAAAVAVALGIWAEGELAEQDALLEAVREGLSVTHPHPVALAAAYGQAVAVREALREDPETIDGAEFLSVVAEATARAERTYRADGRCSGRLRSLSGMLDSFPLDLQDACGGTGRAADEAWPFAIAMFARNPSLVEANLLPAVNVGGDAPTVGACLGALVGALHGWDAFPPDWREGLAARPALESAADALARGTEA